MASRPTNYLANKLIDHLTGTADFIAPGAFYVGLFTDNPTDAGLTASEVVGGSYSRIIISFGAAASRQALSDAIAQFPEALEPWGIVTHYGVMDAVAAGNMLIYGEMQDEALNVVTRNVQVGDIVRWKLGNFKLSIE